MQHPDISKQRDSGSSSAISSGSRLVQALGIAAFLLLASSLAVRPILGEYWTVRANDLVSPSPLWWNGSPGIMYAVHILASLGLLLGATWMFARRQLWRFSGLEWPAGLLVLAALVSIPAASDHRLAINVAVGTILPLLVAAMIYQFLVTSGLCRRALLAALIAVAAANCYASWRQRTSEFEDTYKQYLETKDKSWASQGKSTSDPEVAIYEARLLARQPMGYFYLANVMASFLLLGLAGSAAAAAGLGWRRSWQEAAGRKWKARLTAVAAGVVLVGLAVWQMAVIRWVGSAGALAGLAGGVGVGAGVWLLRRRPVAAAGLCLAVMVGLQLALVAVSMNAATLYPKWGKSDGKLKSVAVRLNYWQGASKLFLQHPIRGVGPGQFGKGYVTVKPIYASEEVLHCHNWLLNVAAEWGVLGLLGTIAALVLPGWRILKGLSGGAGAAEAEKKEAGSSLEPVGDALLLSVGVTAGCCLISLPGIMPAIRYMGEPLALMLAVAVVASLSPLCGRVGVVILLGGLIAFFVHGTVEMGSSIAAAAWPFWACLAVTVAWSSCESSSDSHIRLRRWGEVMMAGTGVAALAVLWLTFSPLSSLLAMDRARIALTQGQPWQAVAELTAAAQTDPLDPAPCAALEILYQRAAVADRPRAVDHLSQAAKAAESAVQRDPLDNVLLNDWAIACARLASATRQSGPMDTAIEAMRKAVDRYPNWPRGRLQLAGMLAAASQSAGGRRDLAEAAIAQMDLALQLDAQWPSEDARRFSPSEIEQIKARRAEVASWLTPEPASVPASQDAAGQRQ